MARSASSIRTVLRRVITTPHGPDIRLSCVLRGSLLGQQYDASVPVLLPSSSSNDSRIATVKTANESWLNETPEFKLLEQKWTHHSQKPSSSFVLHPFILMGSRRGFASGSTKDDPTTDVTPTIPSDGSTEGAENAANTVKDWAESAYNGLLDSARAVGDAVDLAAPPVKKFLEDHPVIAEISVPVTIFTGAWVILPRVLRLIHGYVEMGSAALFQGEEVLTGQEVWMVPYEQSVWNAMEGPARLFATLLTALQVGNIIAPSAAVAQYLTQFWTGGSVLCVVLFLHRWKSNVFKRLLSNHQVTREERERYLAFDKFSSLALILIGALGLAEAAGVAISSLLTVGGIGGIATAFAAREILANLLTGITLSFSKPFTVGDTIKAGAVEGQVKEVGMFSTLLLNPEKIPITVPNGFFTNQAIVNKSRAPWRYLAVKIPIHLNDFEKVPLITMEIREMLHRNPQVYLLEDKPTCHISQFSSTALDLAISCNIKPMSKNEFLLVEQAILVEAARIITTSGAILGGP